MKLILQSIKFETLVIQAGSDNSGVATDMITMNATVKLSFRNTATFFGVHVKPSPVNLDYSRITLASGNVSSLDCINLNTQTSVIVFLTDYRI